MQILKLNKYSIIYFLFLILYITQGCNIVASNIDNPNVMQNTIHGYLINKFVIKQHKDNNKIIIKFNNKDYIKNIGENIPIKDFDKSINSNILIYTRLINEEKCLLSNTSYGFLNIACVPLGEETKEDDSKSRWNKNIKVIRDVEGSQLKNKNFLIAGYTIKTLENALINNFIENKDPNSFLLSMQVFSNKFKVFVTFMLILYTTWFGFDLLTKAINGQSANDIVLFIIKMMLVIYFSTGFAFNASSNNKNGMQEFGLPVIRTIVFYISKSVININIDASKIVDKPKYDNDNITYALTDQIDFAFKGLFQEGNLFKNQKINRDDSSTANIIFRILFLCFDILIFIGIFVMVFLIIFDLITIYAINIIMIYFLIYVSVIFIPCILLNSTRKYYEKWLKILISCIVHIVVLSAFLGFLLYLINYSTEKLLVLDVAKKLLMSIVMFLVYKQILDLIYKITEGLTGAIKFIKVGQDKTQKDKKPNEKDTAAIKESKPIDTGAIKELGPIKDSGAIKELGPIKDSAGIKDSKPESERDTIGIKGSKPESERDTIGIKGSKPESERDAIGIKGSKP